MDTTDTRIEEVSSAAPSIHLIGGPGGSRAILAVSGMLLALNFLGMKKFATIGGISGGSLPLRLLAGGMSVSKIVETAIELQFLNLLESHSKMSSVMADHYRSSRYKGERPLKGIYRSEKLGEWVNSFGAWPQSFWTMAVEGNAQILFTEEGVFERQENQPFSILSPCRHDLGAAIRASCSVPGWFTPVEMTIEEKSRELTLYDGGLSWEGRTPMSIVKDHFGAESRDIIMCDVGNDPGAKEFIISAIWHLVCGGRCITPLGKSAEEIDQEVLVTPVVTSLRSFDFDAHPDRKWEAIMEGFAATVLDLNKSYRLEEEQFLRAKKIIEEFYSLASSLKKAPAGAISERTVKLLTDHAVL